MSSKQDGDNVMSNNNSHSSEMVWATIKSNCTLEHRLEAALPEAKDIHINHISTVPDRCESLYAQAPGQPEEETYREKHFLLASLQHHRDGRIPIYGLEVIVYTTAQLTTIFVSKADSTGFISFTKWPEYAMSPMTAIASTFLRLLADVFQSPDKRLVLSLFARSQHTYLFPGSGDNNRKRILSDAALIKWWARVMNIVMDLDQPEYDDDIKVQQQREQAEPAISQVWLRIPGFSAPETRPFVPKYINETSPFHSVSLSADPFELLAPYPNLPTRCKIPHFVDDPKTRFAEELDGYDKLNANADWYTVTSLDGFWDLMQYRQECAAGKLVGFVWGVFTPKGLPRKDLASHPSLSAAEPAPIQDLETQEDALHTESSVQPPTSSLAKPTQDVEIVHSRNISQDIGKSLPSPLTQQHAQRIMLSETEYDEAQSVLAQGDFSDKTESGEDRETEASTRSMKKWIDHVLSLASEKRFGYVCKGKMTESQSESEEEKEKEADEKPATNTSSLDQVELGKKRTIEDLVYGDDGVKPKTSPKKLRSLNAKAIQPSPINVLSAGMMRKKPKLKPE